MQYTKRSVKLAGKDILILGCGSSKSMLELLARGPAAATFVDVSAPALTALERSVTESGVDAAVAVEYVVADAWDFLSDASGERYDLIMAVKCVGQILAADSSRSTSDMLELVQDALGPDGVFITNHHAAFSQPHQAGVPIGAGLDADAFSVATIGGRYSSDVGYSWDIPTGDLDKVLVFSSSPTPNLYQTWHTFHFRLRQGYRDSPQDRVLLARTQKAPTPLPKLRVKDFDQVADGMIPVNNRGVKRIMVASDINATEVSSIRPKFDGVPGVVVLDGPVGLFSGSSSAIAIPLNASVQPPLVLAGEAVEPAEGGTIVVITGLINVGGVPANPNDPLALASVTNVVDGLNPSGFLMSTPQLTRQIKADSVVLAASAGRVMTLPIDGLNIKIGGEFGTFVKPASGGTIDARRQDIEKAVAFSTRALGTLDTHTVVTADDDDVWEYSLDPDAWCWAPSRKRPDKTFSDTPGAVLATVAAAIRAHELGFVGTTERILGMVSP